MALLAICAPRSAHSSWRGHEVTGAAALPGALLLVFCAAAGLGWMHYLLNTPKAQDYFTN